MIHCIAQNHEVTALANLKPPQDQDEMDSMMYQTVGHEMIELLAEAMQLPLYRQTVEGSCKSAEKTYERTEGDEVEDLYSLLGQVLQAHPDIQGVSVGAILSSYQRTRVEAVCQRLGLTALAYLWQYDQPTLLREMLTCGLVGIVIKVAVMGLDPRKHAGKTLGQLEPLLHKLHQQYQVHVCGEGGEYETFVVDCRLFTSTIVIDETELIIHSDDAFAPVGYVKLKRAHLAGKPGFTALKPAEARAMLSEAGCELYTPPSTACISDSLPTTEVEWTSSASFHSPGPLSSLPADTRLTTLIARSTTNSPREAALEALNRLQQQLDSLNLKLLDVLHVNLTISDMEQFAIINQEYVRFFGRNPPSRVCIACNQAPLVVLEAIVTYADQPHDHLHVQSLSHWAPANIGPYSQAVQISSTLMMAGQIGLDPASMQLVQPADEQVFRALKSVEQVAEIYSTSLGNALSCVCYCSLETSSTLVPQLQDLLRERRFSSCVLPVVKTLPRHAEAEWHWTLTQDKPESIAIALPSGSTRVTGRVAKSATIYQIQIMMDLGDKRLQTEAFLSQLPDPFQRVRDSISSRYAGAQLYHVRAWLLQPGLQQDALDAGMDASLKASFGDRCPSSASVACDSFITNLCDGGVAEGMSLVCVLELAFNYVPVTDDDTDSS